MDELLAEINTVNPSQSVEYTNPYLTKTRSKKFEINKPKPFVVEKKLLTERQTNRFEDSTKIKVPEKQYINTNLIKTKPIENEIIKPLENVIDPSVDDVNMSNCDEFMDLDVDNIDFDEPFDEVEKGFSNNTDAKKVVESIWLNAEMENKEQNHQDSIPPENSVSNNIYWFDAYYDKKIQGFHYYDYDIFIIICRSNFLVWKDV